MRHVALCALCACAALALPASSQSPPPPPPAQTPWLNPHLPVDERVALLLAVMTNEEKQAQTIHLTGGELADVTAAYGATGLGALPQEGSDGPSILARRNAFQGALMNNSRLHIPVSFHEETLHGANGGVIFPMPAAQGASFNAQLVQDIARVVALEAAATGTDRGFSPELNVPTDPRFGRTEENFSEDPCVVSALGTAAVLGLHAGNTGGPSAYLPAGAIASEAKHFAAYAFGGKDGMAADVSERTLHDVYLRPWKAYAAAGGRGAMMAHNSVNAAPCHASGELMGWLRAQGAMAGALLASDMCDVGLLGPAGFRVAGNLTDAAALALGAGLDQELCNPQDGRGQAYTRAAAAVAGGRVAQAALDRAAANALRPKFAAGLFDGGAFANASALGALNAPAHRALARAAAAEGSVLLKNTPGLLPLALPARVALIGPSAGCGDGAPACAASLSQCGGYTNGGVAVVTALSAALNASTSGGAAVTYAQGCAHGGNDTSGFPAALAAAAAADVVVFVGGDSGGLGWNKNTCGEDDDRAELELPGVQADLLDALLRTGKPVVLVLVHGRPVTFVRHGLLARLGAVLATWRPGCEGGAALWDVLTGRVPPSGRLAQSWVRRVGQVRSQASPWFSALQGDFDRVDYNGDAVATGVAGGDSQWSPAWPFMAGGSYTTFAVGSVSAGVSADGASLFATANVSNTGAWPGKLVLGLFFSRPLSALVRSHLALAAFAKSELLAPGAWGTLALSAPLSALASYDPPSRLDVVESGQYELSVRTDSESVVPGGTFLVTV